MRINLQIPMTVGGLATLEAEDPQVLIPSLNFLTNAGLIQAPQTVAAAVAAAAGEQVVQAEEAAGEQKQAEAKPAPKPRAKKAPEEPKTTKAESKLTIQDVTAVVTKLANAKGVGVARELIAAHGAQRASDIKPEQFEAFIAAATAKLNEEEQDDVL